MRSSTAAAIASACAATFVTGAARDLRRDLDDQALSDEIDAYARVTSAASRVALGALSGDRAERPGDAASAAELRQRAGCDAAFADARTWRTIQKALAPLVPTAASSGSTAIAIARPRRRRRS